ncbi:MAG: nucleotidyltransferase family protein [Deltaproteobacteria bacterium]|nr:nucleotidyltransferase family protein [Deltaproteobacteria bacterium]
MELKALILAGGRGKRLENVTSNLNKCMLRFNDKPLIQYSLENAIQAGVSEIVIVVGYCAEDIINNFGIYYRNTRIKYVIQREQRGLVHAIQCAEETIGKADFMTFLGDEILVRPRHRQMVDDFNSSGAYVVCGVTEVEHRENISKTYAVIQDPENNIYRLIEKPRNPMNNIMGTGNCIFRHGMFGYIPVTPISQIRAEKELPDLIQCAIDDGRRVRSFNIGAGYININTETDITAMEQLFQKLVDTEDI